MLDNRCADLEAVTSVKRARRYECDECDHLPHCAPALAALHAAHGSEYVAAPVMGRPDVAEAAQLLSLARE